MIGSLVPIAHNRYARCISSLLVTAALTASWLPLLPQRSIAGYRDGTSEAAIITPSDGAGSVGFHSRPVDPLRSHNPGVVTGTRGIRPAEVRYVVYELLDLPSLPSSRLLVTLFSASDL